MKFDFFNNSNICFSIFRVVFGVLMIEQIISLVPCIYDLQYSHIVLHYPNLEFIEAYSFLLIDILKYTSIIGTILLAMGIIPRVGALLFFFSFGYLFLIDMSWYNNHYYLWCLLAFLFAISDTNNSYSIVDLFKHKNKTNQSGISDITIQSFKILITIVYLYAAFVKLNPDWLQGYPATIWFESRGFKNAHVLGLLMSYIGLIYDLCMPILLWFFARKIWLMIPYFLFHLINAFIFNIGMFPFVMMAAWLLFYNKDTNLSFLYKHFTRYNTIQKMQIFIVRLFILYNLIFPLRFLLYEGRTSWHRQGYYFSWRMMLDNSTLKNFDYLVNIPSLKISYEVNFKQLMNERQLANVFKDPYLIWYVAQILKVDAIKLYHNNNVEVYCKSFVSLNKQPYKNLIIEDINLSLYKYKILNNNKFINL